MSRKIDDLGRMVLPSELRKRFDIHEGDYLGITVEDQRIILTKVETGCVFCDAAETVTEFHGKLVCQPCRDTLSGL